MSARNFDKNTACGLVTVGGTGGVLLAPARALATATFTAMGTRVASITAPATAAIESASESTGTSSEKSQHSIVISGDAGMISLACGAPNGRRAMTLTAIHTARVQTICLVARRSEARPGLTVAKRFVSICLDALRFSRLRVTRVFIAALADVTPSSPQTAHRGGSRTRGS